MIPSLIVIVLLAQSSPPIATDRENPLAKAALAAFASKCVQCHGPDLPFPKAKFGYVTDLGRLVDSQKYVAPWALDRSELWKQIEEGDMPPEEARAGPLTTEETDAIRQWIVGGAPPLELPEAMGPSPEASLALPLTHAPHAPVPTPAAEPRPLSQRLILLIGRLHVLVIHFPIALFMAAALAESRELLRRSAAIPPSVRLCLALGALAAPVAAGLGWVHALDGFAGPLSSPISTAGLHRWLGTAVGVIAPAVVLLSERDVRRGSRSHQARWAIIVLALTVAAASHFGGLLTHGSGYFDP